MGKPFIQDATEAEGLGREAVELGFESRWGMRWFVPDGLDGYMSEFRRNGRLGAWPGASLPDFRDELTALACIPWVRSVWGSVPGLTLDGITVNMCPDGCTIEVHSFDERAGRYQGRTLAHACITAVRAAREAGK